MGSRRPGLHDRGIVVSIWREKSRSIFAADRVTTDAADWKFRERELLTLFYDNSTGLLRVFVVGVLAYVALVVMLRVSGNRTLSKMNAFDFVVTIALGSTLSSIIISKDVALAEGVLALALLIGLQYIVTWLSVRSSQIHRLVKSEPELVLYEGNMLPDAMRRARVTNAEVLAAIRENGTASQEQIAAVVLETDGTFSVVSQSSNPPTALTTVPGADIDADTRQPTGPLSSN